MFAKVLEPIAQPLVAALTGVDKVTPKWQLKFAQTPVEDLVPLERTNFFDDGLYQDRSPSKLSLNENNQDYTPYQL